MTIFPQWIAPILMGIISIAWLFTFYLSVAGKCPIGGESMTDLHKMTEDLLTRRRWGDIPLRETLYLMRDMRHHIRALDDEVNRLKTENLMLKTRLLESEVRP